MLPVLCVFQHPASSEQNPGVSLKSGAGPSGFKQLNPPWLLISPHLLVAGVVLCGRGRRLARELWLGLSRFCQPLSWGFVRNAECRGTGAAIRNWQRWLHCARQAALPDPRRRRLPPLRPASPRLAPPRDACAVNTVFFGIQAFLQESIIASNSINDYLLVLNAK